MQESSLFPTDMFLSDQPDREWGSLKEQTAAAAMKRIDLSYYVYLQESAKGTQGAIERTVLRLGIEGEEVKRGAQVVGDNIKIFKLFRTPAEHGGLGMRRDELAQHSFRRLRVFAQNKDWSKNNLPRIPELLADKAMGEEKIRELINSERGTTAKTATNDRMKFRFDYTLQDGMFVEEVLKAARRRREHLGETLPEVGADGKKLSPEFVQGILLQEILADWLQGDSGAVTPEGFPIPAAEFFTGGSYASENTEEQSDAQPAEAAD